MDSKLLAIGALGLGLAYYNYQNSRKAPPLLREGKEYELISKKPGKPLLVMRAYYDEWFSDYDKEIIKKFKEKCSIVYLATGLQYVKGGLLAFKSSFNPSCIIYINSDNGRGMMSGANSYVNIIHRKVHPSAYEDYKKDSLVNIDVYNIVVNPEVFENHVEYMANLKVHTGFNPKLEAVAQGKDINEYIIQSINNSITNCKS